MDKSAMLKQFGNKDEKMRFSNILDKVCLTKKTNKYSFSDFLNPIESIKYYKSLEKDHDVKIKLYGGYEEAERVVMGIFPKDFFIESTLFPIKFLKISYNSKFSRKLSHRDFLGSIIGLGIERAKIGDIIIKEEHALIVILGEISDFIIENLQKVGNTTVKCNYLDEFLDDSNIEIKEKRFTVPSLRVDAVLSGAFNISRGMTNDFISSDKVILNWTVVNSTSKILKEGDIITIRGKGRIRIKEILGKTKKDRISIIVEIFV